MKVSIIVCTRNRCEDLRLTLQAIGRLVVPEDFTCELLVVDNSSEDGTAEMVRSLLKSNMPIRYFFEPRLGKSNAQNRGLAEANGDIFLFTDDDVRPGENWVEGMCAPIIAGKADAVAGGIILADELERSWMSPMHRAWLAASVRLDPQHPQHMISANMAVARSVFAKVLAFDPELGPGATGGGDDLLFSFQVKEAGFKMVSALDVKVVHYFQPTRLRRQEWLAAARSHGRSKAYLQHHWEHQQIKLVWMRYLKALALLKLYRVRQKKPPAAEGCSLTELGLLATTVAHSQLLVERRRPRNYSRRGLVKLHAEPAVPAAATERRPVTQSRPQSLKA